MPSHVMGLMDSNYRPVKGLDYIKHKHNYKGSRAPDIIAAAAAKGHCNIGIETTVQGLQLTVSFLASIDICQELYMKLL